ncbi:MAG TPA: hypothetical protein VKZ53_04055 [Candidatus Angelobacter sp.]|nr:hypothetical protein [Candidatus Angelobacter sp.]
MRNRAKKMMIRQLALLVVLLCAPAVFAQTTAQGTINATLINKSGISLIFDTDTTGNGVSLGNNGSSNATLDFGNISAFGPLTVPNVSRPLVTAANYTVQTTFDIQVILGGITSPNYTLKANLAAAAATGLTYAVDAVTLTTAAQTIQTTGTYNQDVRHTLSLTVSTAAPGAGGPTLGAQSATLNFTATSN